MMEGFIIKQRAKKKIWKKGKIFEKKGIPRRKENDYLYNMFFHEIFEYFSGENHELHPAKQVTLLGKSISTPSIVVQVCGNEAAEAAGRRIKATRCPDRQNSLD